MFKLLSYLFFSSTTLCFYLWQPYVTSVYTNNFLYVYDKYRDDHDASGIAKYTLKYGPIKDLKIEYFNLGHNFLNYSSYFISIPDDFKNKIPLGDKPWVFSSGNSVFNTKDTKNYPDGDFYIVDDGSRNLEPLDSVELAKSSNMTQSALSVTGVKEGDTYSIYLFGGIANNGKHQDIVVTNTFLKYDATANKWTDLSYIAEEVFPTAFHKAVNVDDKYIYLLGGIHTEEPMNQTSYDFNYNGFEVIIRYNIEKKIFEPISTSISGSALPLNISSGRYGFSAAYYKGKIYVYGGIQAEFSQKYNLTSPTKETPTGYLEILDTETHIWEWYQPKEPNGENSNRKLAFHDSIIWNNQLLLTHGSIADDKYKYKIHAIDLDTKNFTEYITPAPEVKSADPIAKSEFPIYAIAIIVVGTIFVILIIGYLVYKKRRNSKFNNEDKSSPLQEVWAAPQNGFVNTKSGDNTSTGLTENIIINKNLLNSNIEEGSNYPNSSRATQFYMDLPHFQHEVDIEDAQSSNLIKFKSDQHLTQTIS